MARLAKSNAEQIPRQFGENISSAKKNEIFKSGFKHLAEQLIELGYSDSAELVKRDAENIEYHNNQAILDYIQAVSIWIKTVIETNGRKRETFPRLTNPVFQLVIETHFYNSAHRLSEMGYPKFAELVEKDARYIDDYNQHHVQQYLDQVNSWINSANKSNDKPLKAFPRLATLYSQPQ